jgi:hypothetical protein
VPYRGEEDEFLEAMQDRHCRLVRPEDILNLESLKDEAVRKSRHFAIDQTDPNEWDPDEKDWRVPLEMQRNRR